MPRKLWWIIGGAVLGSSYATYTQGWFDWYSLHLATGVAAVGALPLLAAFVALLRGPRVHI